MRTEYLKTLDEVIDINLEILEAISEIRSHKIFEKIMKDSLDIAEELSKKVLSVYKMAKEDCYKTPDPILKDIFEVLKNVKKESQDRLSSLIRIREEFNKSFSDAEITGEVKDSDLDIIKNKLDTLIQMSKEILTDCDEILSLTNDPSQLKMISSLHKKKVEELNIFQIMKDTSEAFKTLSRKEYEELIINLNSSIERSEKALKIGKCLISLKKIEK